MPETLTIGSMFSGYGGLDLAVEAVTGARPAWFVEYDAAPSRILAHHWPDVPNYGDITKVDWSTMQPVDILTGGYPCQPFSAAGKRKGTDDERHLWPYVREAIRHLRPRYVFLENVAGHRSLGFDRVLGDMAEDGMHVRWTSLRASEIGAPHHRDRVFILAIPADSAGERWGEGVEQPIAGTPEVTAPVGSEPPAANSDYERPLGGNGPGDRDSQRTPDGLAARGFRGGQGEDEDVRCGQNEEEDVRGHSTVRPVDGGTNWGDYEPAIRRWEALTRPAPPPTVLNSNNRPNLNPAFAEWMMGLPAGWVTGPLDVDDADQCAFFPSPPRPIPRSEQLKAIGNGVCPPQAAAALRQLLTGPAPAGHFS